MFGFLHYHVNIESLVIRCLPDIGRGELADVTYTQSSEAREHEGLLHRLVGAVGSSKAFQLVDGQELAVAFLHRDFLLRRELA